MRNIIQLLLVSCSILATEAYAGSSSDDDGSSLKRSLARDRDAKPQSQAAKRIRSSEGKVEQSSPKSAVVEVPASVLNNMNVKEQRELALVNKHHHRLVLQYRMERDPRQLHLNPWVLLPDLKKTEGKETEGWKETDLYRLNAAVFHGAKAMMSAQVVNEGEDTFLVEDEWAAYARPIREAREFISGTFGRNGVLASIIRFFEDAEGQLIADGGFNPKLPFPQEIADFSTLNAKSRTIDHKSEYDLMCLHLYLAADPDGGDEFEARQAGWLNSDSETDPYRMNLPKRNAYVYDLQDKMCDSQQYTLEEREEFARKVWDLRLDRSLYNETQSIIDVLMEVANANFFAGNYEKVAESYEWVGANTTHQFDLKDYTRLNETYSTIWVSYVNQMEAYHNQGEQAKVLEMESKLVQLKTKIVETIQRRQTLLDRAVLAP